ncbi:MAG TPA: hypothetical protein VNZ64_08695 [Candidatus Acidoferrum sp.]|jgi:hypothetical protein|nr:hypothetical protein [Candidatus Acidoferrum sp.]
MKTIALSSAISFEELAAWQGSGAEALSFKLTKESDFSAFVEGTAIGKLFELRQRKISIEVQCTFPILTGQLEHFPQAGLGLFSTLFGLALLYESKRVFDSRGQDVKASLYQFLWKRVMESGGNIGDGKKRSIIFREPDIPVPRCLREGERAIFPSRLKFKALLTECGIDLGAGKQFGASQTEDKVATFLYEAARNSHEHGRENLKLEVQSGIRGILIEKVALTLRDEIEKRREFPPTVREYLRRVWDSPSRGLFLISFTVCDFGLGIQHTLVPLPRETPQQRLNRAFKPGESRKPKGAEINRGEGLPKILETYRRLRAFLFLQSAELCGFVDFSKTISPPTNSSDELLCGYSEKSPNELGTSMTLLWPIPSESPDQQVLPL